MSPSVQRLPPWLIGENARLGAGDSLKKRLREGHLVTVCEEARCPNIGECFSSGTATFMLLGDTCTRRCAFCSVNTGRPATVDPGEAERVIETVEALGLRYVVLTMVARDDLDDEGAGQVAWTVRALKQRLPGVEVEVLTSDFSARPELIRTVVEATPEVFGHNIETVRRLTPEIRGRASYDRSLEVLREIGALRATDEAGARRVNLVKSGIMAGMGETREELTQTMRDLRDVGCELLTVGQYLRPTRKHREVARFVEPAEFDEIAAEAAELGFREVASGPLVRSSYRADRLFHGS